jgi:hypothetical protein
LQIIGHVVAKSCANKRSIHTSFDNGENFKNKQEPHFTFVRMGNFPALLLNVKKSFPFWQSLPTFPVIVTE